MMMKIDHRWWWQWVKIVTYERQHNVYIGIFLSLLYWLHWHYWIKDDANKPYWSNVSQAGQRIHFLQRTFDCFLIIRSFQVIKLLKRISSQYFQNPFWTRFRRFFGIYPTAICATYIDMLVWYGSARWDHNQSLGLVRPSQNILRCISHSLSNHIAIFFLINPEFLKLQTFGIFSFLRYLFALLRK